MKRNIFLSLIFLVITIPSFVFAQTKSVVINEIAWMGTPIENVEENQWWRHEWIELYNSGQESLELKGWTIELSRPSSAEASAGKDKLDAKISLSGSVPSQGYFLVASSERIPEADLYFRGFAGKLVNSGQKIVLKNSKGEIVEEVDAREGWWAGDNELKTTMERRDVLQSGNDPKNWQTSKHSGGTPKAQNSIFGENPPAEGSAGTDAQAPYNNKLYTGQAAKKGQLQPFSDDNFLLSPLFLKAFFLALGSAAAILFLKRRVKGLGENQENLS